MTDLDEFFEEAQDEFPSKEDFEDRLVAIWATGKHGTREGSNGKPYGWVETITVALDDGSAGDKATALVGPAPATVAGFQWSAEGVRARVQTRIGKLDEAGNPDYRPVTGRINRRPNVKKGFSDSWSLGKPTDADKAIIRAHRELLIKITNQVKAEAEKVADAEAFD